MDFMKKVNKLTEKVGVFAVDTYKNVTKKSTDLVQEAKIKLIINERAEEIDGIYKEIGKNVYRLFKRGENVEDFIANCKMIESLETEKSELQDTLLSLKNLKKCDNCNASMDKDTAFCPSCGYGMQAEEKPKAKKEKKEAKVEEKEETKTEEKKEAKKAKKEVEQSKMVKIPIKKPAAKTEEKVEVKIEEVEKKPVVKKATTKKEVKTEKKPAVKKATAKKEMETEKKQAVKKTTKKTTEATKKESK